jgi:hypothetical protein
MFGDTGRDTMIGNSGNDVMYGEPGSDLIFGGDGNDQIRGGAGNDTLYGDGGDDYLKGNEGTDWIYGGAGNDQIVGSDETDYMFGDSGNDWLWTSSGQHVISGGAGDDRLSGLDGNDVIIGGDGLDELRGRGGDDLLIGGSTGYDSNSVQLSALFAAWAGPEAYVDRVAKIASESFGARLLSNVTVFDDAVADSIFGDSGQDWFFLTGYSSIYDPNHSANSPGSIGNSQSGNLIVDEPPTLEGFAFVDSLDKIHDRADNESLHSLIPHAGDLSKQREHLTLNQLVRYDQVTHYAVASGDWTNSSTWADGVVPGNGANVLVPVGVNVTVDREVAARINTVRVDGTLSFSTTTSTELRVDTIVVTNIGRFEMGTEDAPIPAYVTAKVLFTDNGPFDRTVDPFGIGRGLISHGSVEIVGAEATPYDAIYAAALAGNTVLTLKAVPSGWSIGDSVVIASSVAGTEQNEVRQIVGVFGNQVLLNQPLAFDHVPYSSEMSVHVANTTRNVLFSSESSVVERRGHVMFMHNDDVHVTNAGFYRLGRTNKEVPINDSVVDDNWQLVEGTGTNSRARYSVHFHRAGVDNDGSPATITGSVVVDSPGWGFVNHSSNVEMIDNVAFDVHGAAFVTEVGDEIGSFVGNIAIGTTGSGEDTESRVSIQDFGHEGDGFWFQGPGVSVTGNIAAGNQRNAFILFARGLIVGGQRLGFSAANLSDPSIAKGSKEVPVQSVPMFRFEKNVGYASALGLSIWYHLEEDQDDQQGVFADSTFWNNTWGVHMPYSRNVVLRDLTIVRKTDGTDFESWGRGIYLNAITRDITFDTLTVSGYYQGIWLPRQGTSTVIGGNYSNHFDFFINTAVKSDRKIYITGQVQMHALIMEPYFTWPTNRSEFYFNSDEVTLNFGPFHDQRVYYAVQAADAIPFPNLFAGLRPEFVGLTSQQLWDQYGVAVGGEIASANTISVSGVIGLIGPAGE